MGVRLVGSLTVRRGPPGRHRTAHSQIHLEVQQNFGLDDVGNQTAFGIE